MTALGRVPVMLNGVKHLGVGGEILRFAQDDDVNQDDDGVLRMTASSMGRGMLPLPVIRWAFCPLITYRSLRAPPRAARPGNSGPE